MSLVRNLDRMKKRLVIGYTHAIMSAVIIGRLGGGGEVLVNVTLLLSTPTHIQRFVRLVAATLHGAGERHQVVLDGAEQRECEADEEPQLLRARLQLDQAAHLHRCGDQSRGSHAYHRAANQQHGQERAERPRRRPRRRQPEVQERHEHDDDRRQCVAHERRPAALGRQLDLCRQASVLADAVEVG